LTEKETLLKTADDLGAQVLSTLAEIRSKLEDVERKLVVIRSHYRWALQKGEVDVSRQD
jgi:site-specific recombinase XerD